MVAFWLNGVYSKIKQIKGFKMDINELTIGQAKELACLFGGVSSSEVVKCSPLDKVVGKVCVVRTYSAGVHIGKVVSVNGTECELEDSQRLWNWKGAFTLTEVAMNGVSSESRMSNKTQMFLTQAIEFIPCSEKAIESFKNTKVE